MMSPFLSVTGIMVFLFLMLSALYGGSAPTDLLSGGAIQTIGAPEGLRLLALGDINLGRNVGQNILRGNVDFPFEYVRDSLLNYDVVFGNLECQLSDQNGETQDPENNLIFTGPPDGAKSLKRGGVTIVSTANNHALDYGIGASAQTMEALEAEGIPHAGTSADEERLYDPVWLRKNNVLLAFFACTDIMNIEDPVWKKHVASADSSHLFPAIRAVRSRADLIIVSYHGGNEYDQTPTDETVRFAHGALSAGADLFLGHHPHVPQRIERVGSKIIVYSLGNFVFQQPFRYWTQRSFAFEADIRRDGEQCRLMQFRCIPVLAGDQPRIVTADAEGDEILQHLVTLSRDTAPINAWND